MVQSETANESRGSWSLSRVLLLLNNLVFKIFIELYFGFIQESEEEGKKREKGKRNLISRLNRNAIKLLLETNKVHCGLAWVRKCLW